MSRTIFSGTWLLALALLASCERNQIAPPRATLPAVPRGEVTWLDPETSSTWSGSEKPYFLFLFSSRSYWSREMVRESFTVPAVVREIERVTRPVWIDADLRPDLVARYALGALPSLAILTPDLKWITGTTFMEREDMSALLRRIRILYGVAGRRKDLERERGRLLRQRPLRVARFAYTHSLSELSAALFDSIRLSDVGIRSSESQLLLVEGGEDSGQADWVEMHAGPGRVNDDGLFVASLLSDDGRIRDETTSLGHNAGLLYTLARIAKVTQDDALEHSAYELALAIAACLYDVDGEAFISGTADFSFPDSNGIAQPVVAVPSLLDARSITAWNALAVSAFCEVDRIRPDQRLRSIAKRTLNRLLERRVRNNEVWRTDPGRTTLQLEDAAHLIRACLDYADLTGDDPYYADAIALANHTIDAIPDVSGEMTDVTPTSPLAMIGVDGDFGSSAGVLAQSLVRLYMRDGNERYAERAESFCRRAIAANVERQARLGALGRALRQLSEIRKSSK